MSLNRIQQQFVKLVNRGKTKWGIPYRRSYKHPKTKRWIAPTANIKIINAVTGEETTAKAYNDTPAGLKKWLKLKNVRARFSDMVILKNSAWGNLKNDDDFKDYPIIVKIGTYQVPYLIEQIGERKITGKKVTCLVFLKTVDNIDYLSIISKKKELLEKGKKKSK